VNLTSEEFFPITQNFDSIFRIVDTTTEQQFPGRDGLFGGGGKPALVDPILQPVEVHCGIFLCILVIETSLGNQLGNRGLSTLKTGFWTGTGSGLLSIVTTTRGASVAGPLAPSDSLLVVKRTGCRGDVEEMNLWDFARVFHPTEKGHEAITGAILEFLGVGN